MDERNGSVLVVDDNEAVRTTLVRVLESRCYQPIGVASGEDAILQLRDRSFDIALCDIHLPGMNGIETALAIRRSLPECRVLLMSGDSGSSDLLDSAERAGHRFEVLTKPFDPATLFSVITMQPFPTA
jgi:two-component system, sensor histidine kinase